MANTFLVATIFCTGKEAKMKRTFSQRVRMFVAFSVLMALEGLALPLPTELEATHQLLPLSLTEAELVYKAARLPVGRLITTGRNVIRKRSLIRFRPRGGHFGELEALRVPGVQHHHMISKNAFSNSVRNNRGLNEWTGPGIQMRDKHHRLLPSSKPGPAGDAFRNKQRDLLNAGRPMDAFEEGVREIKAAGLYRYYRRAIREARRALVRQLR